MDSNFLFLSKVNSILEARRDQSERGRAVDVVGAKLRPMALRS
jgi:hypothetical protein